MIEKFESAVNRVVEARKHRKAQKIQADIATATAKAAELVKQAAGVVEGAKRSGLVDPGAKAQKGGAFNGEIVKNVVMSGMKEKYHAYAVRVLELDAELKASIAAGGVA